MLHHEVAGPHLGDTCEFHEVDSGAGAKDAIGVKGEHLGLSVEDNDGIVSDRPAREGEIRSGARRDIGIVYAPDDIELPVEIGRRELASDLIRKENMVLPPGEVRDGIDPPPLNWSTLKYVF